MTITLTRKQRIKIRCSDDAFKIMQEILLRESKIDRDKEHFWVMGLAPSTRVLFVELVSLGCVANTYAEPINVFRFALTKGCVSVILIHNHPSGRLKPSEKDLDLTDNLIQVGRIIKVEVLDHLIISTRSHMSFADTDLMEKLKESTKYVPPFELVERIRAEEKKIREEAVRLERERMDRIIKVAKTVWTKAGQREGRIKGKKVGKKEGIKEGEKKKAVEMARVLLLKGVDIDIIIESSGLTKEEIEKIK